ncbi:TetR/AcrR family transcriptional regulator [Marinimicrobium koreense]|mgnify:CR=1 FL=1|jgi:TetR/AcrR family transcriptional repressor of nem operon|uniref:TetR/AcrR family transcriptional regulator n=1 Tax=Marinimicrobium koreense TaxID=306545 RepID=UPI003F6FDBCE|tara:strand:+ start:1010 stop:1612 length:603 start_codon:yes stop_codon:yes gene_type:complete
MVKTGSAGRGRPMQFDPEQALQKAMLLFWARGYEATSTAQLMATMGLSKSSLYQTFGSKDALFNLCLDRYGEMTAGHMRETLAQAESPKQFLLDLVEAIAGYHSDDSPNGCLLVNSACELGADNAFAGPMLLKRRDKAMAILQQACRAMAENGELPYGREPDSVANQIFALMCGLRVMERMGFEPQQRQDCLQMVEALLS